MFIKMLTSYAKIAANAKRTIDLEKGEIIDATIDSYKTSLLTYNILKLLTYKKLKK